MQSSVEAIFVEIWIGTWTELQNAIKSRERALYVDADFSKSRWPIPELVNCSLVNPNLVDQNLRYDRDNIAVRCECASFRRVSCMQWKCSALIHV